MNKKLGLCVLIFLLVMIFVLAYYANLTMNLNHNAEKEKQTLEDIKHVIRPDESTDEKDKTTQDSNEKQDENITITQDTVTEKNTESNASPIHPKESDDNKEDKLPKGFDCIISIPSISLEKIVYTGNSREQYLSQYDLITATDDMRYGNGGNYIVCGHNSQLYGHSLNRLKEVKEGDYVYINSNDILHKYIVYSKEFQTMSDTSLYCVQTEQRELTIISCAKYIGPDKYIVIKCELETSE